MGRMQRFISKQMLIDMIASVIVWAVVAALLLIVFVARIVAEHHRSLRPVHAAKHHSHSKFIELGKEREEFFATGDSDLIPGDDYDIYYNS